MHKVITCDSTADLDSFFKDLTLYKDDIDLDGLKNEVSTYITYKATRKEIKWEKLNHLRREFVKLNLKSIFKNIYKALLIYLAIPVSSNDAERAFSCLRRLKTWLRTVMGETRLSSLAVMNIESEFRFRFFTGCICQG